MQWLKLEWLRSIEKRYYKPLMTMNKDRQLLEYLDTADPGQYVVITEELVKLFPPPIRFNYPDYARELRSWLYELEKDNLVKLTIPQKDLFDSAFGDLNHTHCDLGNYRILGKITRQGIDYLANSASPKSKVTQDKTENKVVKFLKSLAEASLAVKTIIGTCIAIAAYFGIKQITHSQEPPSHPTIQKQTGKDAPDSVGSSVPAMSTKNIR